MSEVPLHLFWGLGFTDEDFGDRGLGQRFRGGLVFKAHRLCVSLNSRLGSNKEEEEKIWGTLRCFSSRRSRRRLHSVEC